MESPDNKLSLGREEIEISFSDNEAYKSSPVLRRESGETFINLLWQDGVNYTLHR